MDDAAKQFLNGFLASLSGAAREYVREALSLPGEASGPTPEEKDAYRNGFGPGRYGTDASGVGRGRGKFACILAVRSLRGTSLTDSKALVDRWQERGLL